MEKGMGAQTMSTEIFENCGNFWIVEGCLLFFLMETSYISKHGFKESIFGILSIAQKS